MNLRLHLSIGGDRTGDQLREHAEECPKLQKGVCRFDLFEVHINEIRRDLECVEADAQRHDEMRRRNRKGNVDGGEQRIKIFHKEVGVLENRQPPEVVDHTADEIVLGFLGVVLL